MMNGEVVTEIVVKVFRNGADNVAYSEIVTKIITEVDLFW
jgi:hypothetical protein